MSRVGTSVGTAGWGTAVPQPVPWPPNAPNQMWMPSRYPGALKAKKRKRRHKDTDECSSSSSWCSYHRRRHRKQKRAKSAKRDHELQESRERQEPFQQEMLKTVQGLQYVITAALGNDFNVRKGLNHVGPSLQPPSSIFWELAFRVQVSRYKTAFRDQASENIFYWSNPKTTLTDLKCHILQIVRW